MLESLKYTGMNARLTPEVYELYKEEISAFEESWKQSLHYLETCNFSFIGGIDDNHIPSPYCQYDYSHIIYDYRECREVKDSKSVPAGYKTMLDGGTVPCALMSILDYLCISSISLEYVGKKLVENGYRTEDNGTLWIAFDKALEQLFGVRTWIQRSVFELCESVTLERPVIALVPAAWLHDFPAMKTRECIIVWRLEEKKAVITTTSAHSAKKVDLYELLKNIKRAWACQRIN